MYIAISSKLWLLFSPLILISAQGDPGHANPVKGSKGDKGQEGPEVRHCILFISLSLALLIVHMCRYEIYVLMRCLNKKFCVLIELPCTIVFSLWTKKYLLPHFALNGHQSNHGTSSLSRMISRGQQCVIKLPLIKWKKKNMFVFSFYAVFIILLDLYLNVPKGEVFCLWRQHLPGPQCCPLFPHRANKEEMVILENLDIGYCQYYGVYVVCNPVVLCVAYDYRVIFFSGTPWHQRWSRISRSTRRAGWLFANVQTYSCLLVCFISSYFFFTLILRVKKETWVSQVPLEMWVIHFWLFFCCCYWSVFGILTHAFSTQTLPLYVVFPSCRHKVRPVVCLYSQIASHVTEPLKGFPGDLGLPGQPGLPGLPGSWAKCYKLTVKYIHLHGAKMEWKYQLMFLWNGLSPDPHLQKWHIVLLFSQVLWGYLDMMDLQVWLLLLCLYGCVHKYIYN